MLRLTWEELLEQFGKATERPGRRDHAGGGAVILSQEEYNQTHEYAERLQQILLELRQTHQAGQFEAMSRGFLKELTKAQREIAFFLASPEVKT